MRYGAGDAFDSRWYAAEGCEVKGHATLECTRLAEGVGAALRVRVGGIGPRGCSVAQCQTSRIVADDEAALLSYAGATWLDPRRRVRALATRSTSRRLALVVSCLRDYRARLAALVALRGAVAV